jgi:ribose transport system ATP-binding protein
MLASPKDGEAVVLAARDITKAFDGVTVLQGVDFDLRAGEIHALVGENGAGKSTLMKILSGIIADHEGTLHVDGAPARFASVREAQAAGIAIIHQELNLIPEMTIAENIFLGREPRRAGFVIQRGALNGMARTELDRIGMALDPNVRVGSLRVGEQQLVEIAKALSLHARILIMDEPTSALSPAECERLFRIIRRLTVSGVAIVYISHRMDEIQSLADRVTVLRDGRLVLTSPIAGITPERIIASMVGRDLMRAAPREHPTAGKTVLAVRNLGLRVAAGRGALKDALGGVSFTVGRGEVVGIAGLLGSGRTEILTSIFGSAEGELRGSVEIDGRPVSIGGPRDAVRNGIALVTEDRKATGLLLQSSIRDNVSLPSEPLKAKWGLRDPQAEARLARGAIDTLRIRCRDDEQQASHLSGGNQQKVVIGKWLAVAPRILLLDEPTRGIDVGAKKEIYDLIFRLADQGLAIVVVSSELPELLLVADRILVMREGRQAGILDRGSASEEAIMMLASPRRVRETGMPAGRRMSEDTMQPGRP